MSDKDELIVDILEKVSDKVDHLSVEQARQSVVLEFNTNILNEHARRSKASEARLELLEKDSLFFRNAFKAFSILGAAIIGIAKLYSLIHQ